VIPTSRRPRAFVGLKDIPDSYTLDAIARLYHALTGRLVDARHGIGEVLPKERLAEHAIGALAAQHVMAERALHSRWINVADALTYGATFAAMSLDADEVAVELRSWADGQLRHGGITDAEHEAVMALIPTEV
jgi:hypothetical protein